ncbi:hypothetical protein DENSPDRAFT_191579 [Dentipellis sp. KUC8613]|nr:hypothetical protein DENSPDRAFT_191579 [Dentipellis sp. KUC8613]
MNSGRAMDATDAQTTAHLPLAQAPPSPATTCTVSTYEVTDARQSTQDLLSVSRYKASAEGVAWIQEVKARNGYQTRLKKQCAPDDLASEDRRLHELLAEGRDELCVSQKADQGEYASQEQERPWAERLLEQKAALQYAAAETTKLMTEMAFAADARQTMMAACQVKLKDTQLSREDFMKKIKVSDRYIHSLAASLKSREAIQDRNHLLNAVIALLLSVPGLCDPEGFTAKLCFYVALAILICTTVADRTLLAGAKLPKAEEIMSARKAEMALGRRVESAARTNGDAARIEESKRALEARNTGVRSSEYV